MNPLRLSQTALPVTPAPAGRSARNTAPWAAPWPRPAARPPARWQLAAVAGRLVEISGGRSGASLTLAFRLLLEAQQQNEPTAWITSRSSLFFPPDVERAGVDLAALAVIRTPTVTGAASAAEHLLRSGAFGLVAMDLGKNATLPPQAQIRLAAQARRHAAVLLCLTEKERPRPSLGSLVSLRAHTARRQQQNGALRCQADVLKDKRRGPGWRHVEVCRGPDGLC